MLSNPMLGVAINLIFMYLLLSIIVTMVQEFIASTLRLHSRNLVKAVEELIEAINKKDFYNHPLIFPLFRGEVDDKMYLGLICVLQFRCGILCWQSMRGTIQS